MKNLISAEDVREIRIKSGLTQKGFGKACGVSTKLVSMTEQGIKPVSLQYLQKIADGMNMLIVITIEPNF